MTISDDESDEGMTGMFMQNEEEEEKITLKYDVYHRSNAPEFPSVSLALVSKHHSLWAEFVYNAARVVADLMDHNEALIEKLCAIDVKDKKCLELGAGAGLPGLIAALNGASSVVISDYGHDFDLSLIYPIDANIAAIKPFLPKHTELCGVGYVWGYPPQQLILPNQYYELLNASIDISDYQHYCQSKLSHRIVSEQVHDENLLISNEDKFDIIFLADLIFNRSEHQRLLWTVWKCLKANTGICYVSFSHHDPQKAELDMNFFKLAQEAPYNLEVQKIGEDVRQSYPFREQDGLDGLRGVIHLYTLRLVQ